jgi:hypothetical protein
MITTQNNLPDSSRVWVYQGNRAFSATELVGLKEKLTGFEKSWEAHGTKLNSAIEIFYDQFIVVFVDEAPQEATGCSIDKSVGIMKSIEQEFEIALLDRMNLAYKEGDSIVNLRMAEFQDAAKEGKVNENTIVFNNLVESKADFIANWETKAANSWHKNML